VNGLIAATEFKKCLTWIRTYCIRRIPKWLATYCIVLAHR